MYIWRKRDYLSFNERFSRAREAHCDYLESMAMERLENPTGNRGSDVLLMGKLTAENPTKWNRSFKVTHEVPNELIQQLRKLQQLGSQPALEDGDNKDRIIDGEAKVMPWEE